MSELLKIVHFNWGQFGTNLSATSGAALLGILGLDAAGVGDDLGPVIGGHRLVADL